MVGRLVNITGEVLLATHNQDLRNVFFTSPGTKAFVIPVLISFLFTLFLNISTQSSLPHTHSGERRNETTQLEIERG